jgi:predicted MFS family arabinose efflux permease
MNPTIIGGVIRTAIAVVSGALLGGGVIDQDAANQATGNIETIIGAATALATLGWSIWAKLHPADPK